MDTKGNMANQPNNRKAYTFALSEEVMTVVANMARRESRPISQQVEILIELGIGTKLAPGGDASD